jgi:cell division protein FtsI/penicillin-binding protein 2
MTEDTDALYEKALELSDNVPDNFVGLGRALSQLYDLDPELFRKLAAKSNMGLRKAYDLVEISRTLEPLTIRRDRLRKIGWPKLQLIAKHVTPNALDALLQLAEDMTAKDLERHVRREKPLGNAHCVLRYFSPKSYEQLEETHLSNGSNGAAPSRGAIK